MVHHIVAFVQEFHHFSAQKWQHQTEEKRKTSFTWYESMVVPSSRLLWWIWHQVLLPRRYVYLHAHILCMSTWAHFVERIKNSTWSHLKCNNILEIPHTSGIRREKNIFLILQIIFFFFCQKIIKVAILATFLLPLSVYWNVQRKK